MILEQTAARVLVRGEDIEVNGHRAYCAECHQPMAVPEVDDELFAAAYQEYRHAHSLVSPREIADIRAMYGLSQRGLAKLLGWGTVTIHRYEKDALPDAAHNQILKTLRDPGVVIGLLDDPHCQLAEVEKVRVRTALRGRLRGNKVDSAVTAMEALWEAAEPDEYTGYRGTDPTRLMQMVAYFADALPSSPYKVKLMKLLFYSDFLHFARHGVSISGFKYAAIPMGPVPDDYEMFITWAKLSGLVRVEFVNLSHGQPAEVLVPQEARGPHCFADSEMDALRTVARHCGRMSGAALARLSHEEPAWKDTDQSGWISYEWAHTLQAVPVAEKDL